MSKDSWVSSTGTKDEQYIFHSDNCKCVSCIKRKSKHLMNTTQYRMGEA